MLRNQRNFSSSTPSILLTAGSIRDRLQTELHQGKVDGRPWPGESALCLGCGNKLLGEGSALDGFAPHPPKTFLTLTITPSLRQNQWISTLIRWFGSCFETSFNASPLTPLTPFPYVSKMFTWGCSGWDYNTTETECINNYLGKKLALPKSRRRGRERTDPYRNGHSKPEGMTATLLGQRTCWVPACSAYSIPHNNPARWS